MNYSFHPAARKELFETQDYYRERSDSVALAFSDENTWAIDQITLAPKRWKEHEEGTRKFLLSRFPYSVIYRALGNDFQVVAIAHHRRRPGYWSPRLIS